MRHEDAGSWALRYAELERERAGRSAARAAERNARARQGLESLRPMHARLGALYHRIEERHLASARLHGLFAVKLYRWANSFEEEPRPGFPAAIAEVLGVPSALAVLHGRRHSAAVVAASDQTARAAHDLELVMAEGPTIEAARYGTPVQAAGTALTARWPQYGAAVTELGVQAVVAAPLGLPGARIGALCALSREPDIGADAALAASGVAEACTVLLLRLADPPLADGGSPALSLFAGPGDPTIMHQAAGMVSVHCDCSIEDARELLAMRAFAEGEPVADIAVQVVHGGMRLG